jgi:hypothetical protein
MADGLPRCITALGDIDVAGGWRTNEARSDVLLDVPITERLAESERNCGVCAAGLAVRTEG